MLYELKKYSFSHFLSSSSWANNEINRDSLTAENAQRLLQVYTFGLA